MKTILSLILALVTFGVQAQTVTLEPSGCGVTRYCPDVANDAGAEIALYASPLYDTFTLIVNGKAYTGADGDFVGAVAYATDGSWLTLTATFSTYRTYSGSGRGQHWSTHYTLTGGSVVLP